MKEDTTKRYLHAYRRYIALVNDGSTKRHAIVVVASENNVTKNSARNMITIGRTLFALEQQVEVMDEMFQKEREQKEHYILLYQHEQIKNNRSAYRRFIDKLRNK